MVKFAESLTSKENPEWAAHYINYQELKDMLYEGIAKAPKITTAADVGKFDFVEYATRFDQSFYEACKVELDKINQFYREKVRECSKRFLDLKNEAEGLQSQNFELGERQNFWKRTVRRNSAAESQLRQAYRDFYAELGSLSKYKDLNYVGFRKILRKHDKLFSSTSGSLYLRMRIYGAYFRTNKDVESLIHQTESIVTTVFEDGSRAKAMKILHMPRRDDKLNAWTAFKMGLMFGAGIVLVAVFAVSGVVDPSKNGWRIVVRLYRGPAFAVMFICLIGINIYVWRQRGINYTHMFDLNPRDTLLHHHFWNIAAVLGVMWAISLVVFLNAKNIGLPVYVPPLVMVATQMAFLLNPFPCGYRNSRLWLFKVVFRCFTAPFYRVRFADFWVADQMASLVTIALDYQYIICFYTNEEVFSVMDDLIIDKRVCVTFGQYKCHCDSSKNVYRPIIRAIPSLIRMLQCFRRFYDNHLVHPHLVNAMKYFTSLMATVISTLHSTKPPGMDHKVLLYMWIFGSIASSLYSFAWDIKMDWGLSDWRAENRFLRSELLYIKPWYYYAAIGTDFVLRFVWAISLSLTEMRFVQSDFMLTATTPLEVFRRFMWNLFRLENEQINNNNAQKATELQADVSTTSMELTEEQHMKDLLQIMDNYDGAEKVRMSPVLKLRSFTGSTSRIFPDTRSELFTKLSSIEEMGSLTEASSTDNLYPRGGGARGKCRGLCCWKA